MSHYELEQLISPPLSTFRFVSGAPQKVFADLAKQFGKKSKL